MNNVVWLGDEEEAKLPTISFHTNFINVQAGFASFIHYFVTKENTELSGYLQQHDWRFVPWEYHERGFSFLVFQSSFFQHCRYATF